jgi:hypothetical protein
MCLDPDVVSFHLYAILLYAFFKLLSVFDLFFITPGTMFQASTTLFKLKFRLDSSLAACGSKFKGSAALLVVLMETSTL